MTWREIAIFFIGCCAAWGFMGIVLFGADIIARLFGIPKRQNVAEKRLLEYWDVSTKNQERQIRAIRLLETAVLNLKTR